jgi:flagellar biosynthesis protein FlhF
MKSESFVGPSIPQLMAEARAKIGANAVLLSVRRLGDLRSSYELVAAHPEAAEADPRRTQVRREPRMAEPIATLLDASRRTRPFVVALVGSTGAGKTTTIAKLIQHPYGFGGRSVGLVCLDTFRVGAVEESRIYARLCRVPLAVVHETWQIFRVLGRMKDRQVILVDTPGRGPGEAEDTAAVQAQLRLLRPDEVHLTLPAGLSPRRARRTITQFRGCGVTHLLPTKLDEERDGSSFALAAENDFAMRWLTDGQDIRQDLQLVSAWRTRVGRWVERRREPVAGAA